MSRIHKPASFVIVATGHGTMIVNRNDAHMTGPMEGFGVGMQLLQSEHFDASEVDMALELLRLRRAYHGDGVVALDCGANVGVHAIEWARYMTGWGEVVAFEPQERIYYALAGNIAINNCFNARAILAAVGAESGTIEIPVLDYTKPASYGSLELRPGDTPTQFIGQAIDYEAGPKAAVSLLALDDLGLQRLDFVKLDVEGMELDALKGARRSLEAHKPILLVEHLKAAPGVLESHLKDLGYHCIMTPLNILAVHLDDPGLVQVK